MTRPTLRRRTVVSPRRAGSTSERCSSPSSTAAQRYLDGAIDLLDEAERVHVPGVVPDIHPVAAQKARVWIAQGRVSEALDWVRQQGLSADDDLTYMREFGHITLARILVAKGGDDR